MKCKNTVDLTLHVTSDSLIRLTLHFMLPRIELKRYCLQYIVVTVRELQSLLGKLHFVSSCVRPGRIFVSRLLIWIRSLPDDKEYYNIPLFAKKDLIWRSKFLNILNGVSMIVH
jgi:hypothetical protein